MHFVILATDRPGMLRQRLEHRQAHLDYWSQLSDVVKIAGAMLDDTSTVPNRKGSYFLVEAECIERVRELVARDPFMLEEIFGADVRIEAVRPVIGSWLQE